MIKIIFSDGVEKVHSPNHFYQWDKGQQIEISGLGDVGTPEIHIGYTGMMSAVVVNSTVSNDKIYVNIPNKLLMSGKDLRVHINIATTNSNTTIKSILIPVVKRNMPDNYVVEDGDLQWIEEFKDVSVDFNNRITSNSEGLNDVRKELTNFNNRITSNSEGLNDVRKELTNFNNRITSNSEGLNDTTNQVDELKSDLDTVGTLGNQLLKESDYKVGKFFNINTDNWVYESESASAKIVGEWIPLKANKTYYYKDLYAYYSFYTDDSRNNGIRFSENISSKISGTITPNVDCYAFLSGDVNAKPMFSDKKLPSEYTEGKYCILNNQDELDSLKGVTFVVSKNGDGNFTTLIDVLTHINTNNIYNAIVYVKDGVYDLVQEYVNKYGHVWGTDYGLVIKNNTHMIFSNNSVVKFEYTEGNENVMTYFSPFNVKSADAPLDNSIESGFTLENMTLIASNCRYCVHDEHDRDSGFYKNRYINCYMYLDNRNNTYWKSTRCIGGGLGRNGLIEIIGCSFYGEQTDGETVVEVSYHNSYASNSKSKIIIKDCYFRNGTIRAGYYGSSTEITQIFISNNSVKHEPYIEQETEEFNVENIELIKWNNEIRNS